MISLPSSPGQAGGIGDLSHLAADEVCAFLEQAVVELLVALGGGADVDVEVVDLCAGAFSCTRWANFRLCIQQMAEQ